MSEVKKVEDKTINSLINELNQIPIENVEAQSLTSHKTDKVEHNGLLDELEIEINEQKAKDDEVRKQIEESKSKLFDLWEANEFVPDDFDVDIPIDSLEARVGFSSLVRQFNDSFTERIAFYRSFAGGSLSLEEARERAFHHCENDEEAKKLFSEIMSVPYENIFFSYLHQLWEYAPRVAERLWEMIKIEGRKEFESGHLSANTMFPVHYMKEAWNIARYLGLRESLIGEWQPKGGIEISLIDMMAQSFFQWQYWMEQVVKRSETEPRREHHEYQKWKQMNEKTKDSQSWQKGYWFPPYVHEQAAIEHAVQMADSFNRIYLRTLRQLRDLRRYSPVTINNPNQVNIAADGGQQVNVSKIDDESSK